MKIFTKHIVVYAFLVAVYTLLFRVGLSYCLDQSEWTWLWVVAGLYGLMLFVSGWFLGKAEVMRNSFFDLGLRMHLTTYLIFAAISLGWFYLGNPNPNERIRDIILALTIWGVMVIIHVVVFLLTRKYTIRGIRKDELFGN